MNRKLFLLLILIIFMVSACTLAPEYIKPDSPVPALWPVGPSSGEAQKEASQNISELKWREFFPDSRLQKIIEISLENNRDLRLATLNVERARAMYGVQRAELFPSLGAAGSGAKERVPADLSKTGNSMISESYAVNMGISSWEIDFFGRIRSLKEVALESFLATDQARRSAQISIVSSVAQAYLTLAADREALGLARSTMESQKASYDLMQKKYNAGIANDLQLRQSQAQFDTARGELARSLQSVAQDQNILNLLIGSPLPEDLLPPDLEGMVLPKTISPAISSEVLLIRPDILQAEHMLKGTYANIGAARAAFFPRIALTTSLGTASADLSGLFKDGSSTWSFVPQVTLPIFDARMWSAYDVTKIDKEIALAQYEKAIQTAFREVADALAVGSTIDERVAAQQSLVVAVGETFRLSNELYEKGISSYLGVLDAQRSLYAAQQGLILLRLARITNRVRLYAVLGGGSE